MLSHDFAKQATELAEEYGLELWRAYGMIELGWIEAELGNVKGGIEQMERGLALHESMGSKLRLPYFLALLADQLMKGGRVEEGVEEITKALTLAKQTGEGFALAELYRIKGDLLMKAAGQSQPRVARNTNPDSNDSSAFLAQAQTCFAEGLTVAKQQQAVSWQTKIAARLDHLKERATWEIG